MSNEFEEIDFKSLRNVDLNESITNVGKKILADRPEEHKQDDEENEEPFFDVEDEEEDEGSNLIVTTTEPDETSEDPITKMEQPVTKTDTRANKRIRDLVAEKNKLKEELQKERLARLEQEKTLTLQTKSSHLTQKDALEKSLKALNAQLATAFSEGDHEKFVEINDSILNTKMKLAGLEYEVKSIGDDSDIEKQYEEKVKQAKTAQEVPDVDERALEWVDNHPEFKTDPLFQANAMLVDKMLVSEGVDPSSDAYYIELDKRLSMLFPKYFGKNKTNVVESEVDSEASPSVKPQQVVTKPKQTVASSGVSQASTGIGKPQNKDTQVKINKYDVMLAERWGIPLKEFAKVKKQVESTGQSESNDGYISIF